MPTLVHAGALSPGKIETILPSGSSVSLAYLEPRWYAAYTRAHHESRVAQQLERRYVEHFLPRYETVRRWKDRRVRLQLPLFPGYIFVRLALRDRLQVLQVPGVVHLVGFSSLPTPVPEWEIEALRMGLAHPLRAGPHPYLSVGRRVRIQKGPLAGLEGILVRKKGTLRVVLSIHLIRRSVAVDIDAADVAPLLGRPGLTNPLEATH